MMMMTVKPEYRYTQARMECPECGTMNIKGLTFCKVCDKDLTGKAIAKACIKRAAEKSQQKDDGTSMAERIMEIRDYNPRSFESQWKEKVKKHRLRALQILKQKYGKNYDPFTFEWPITARWRLDNEYAMQMAAYGTTYEDIKNLDVVAIEMFNLKLPQRKSREEIAAIKQKFLNKTTRQVTAAHYANIIATSRADIQSRILRHGPQPLAHLHRTRKGRIWFFLFIICMDATNV